MEQEMETLTHSMAELDAASAEYDVVADRFHRIQHEFQRNRTTRHAGAESSSKSPFFCNFKIA